jgi:hypothetical protein
MISINDHIYIGISVRVPTITRVHDCFVEVNQTVLVQQSGSFFPSIESVKEPAAHG